jgi:hypothetical protein
LTIDHVRKPARERAARHWKNSQVERNFKKAKKDALDGAAKNHKQPELAEVLEPEKIVKVTFESKFLKDIKAMLDEHKKRNELVYLKWIYVRRKRLLVEKLRRLEAREAEREREAHQQIASPVAQQKRDLFT